MFLAICKRVLVAAIIASALYYTTDISTTCFFIAVAAWILFQLPSFPFLLLTSISFVAALLAMLIGQNATSAYLATVTYYTLVAFSASEVTSALMNTRSHKDY